MATSRLRRSSTTPRYWAKLAARVGSSNRCASSQASCLPLQSLPPRQIRSWRSMNAPRRRRAFVEVDHHVGPGTAQVPDRLLRRRRYPDGDQLSGPVQPGQPLTVPLVGLDAVTRGLGDERWSHHLAAHPQPLQLPAQLVTGRPGEDRPSGQRSGAPSPRRGRSSPRPSSRRGEGLQRRWSPCARPSRGGSTSDAKHWTPAGSFLRGAPSAFGLMIPDQLAAGAGRSMMTNLAPI